MFEVSSILYNKNRRSWKYLQYNAILICEVFSVNWAIILSKVFITLLHAIIYFMNILFSEATNFFQTNKIYKCKLNTCIADDNKDAFFSEIQIYINTVVQGS